MRRSDGTDARPHRRHHRWRPAAVRPRARRTRRRAPDRLGARAGLAAFGSRRGALAPPRPHGRRRRRMARERTRRSRAHCGAADERRHPPARVSRRRNAGCHLARDQLQSRCRARGHGLHAAVERRAAGDHPAPPRAPDPARRIGRDRRRAWTGRCRRADHRGDRTSGPADEPRDRRHERRDRPARGTRFRGRIRRTAARQDRGNPPQLSRAAARDSCGGLPRSWRAAVRRIRPRNRVPRAGRSRRSCRRSRGSSAGPDVRSPR